MYRYLIFSLLVLLSSSACTQQSSKQLPDSYKIGAIFSLTDFGAHWGKSERNAAVMAAEEINRRGGINNHPLELIIEDNQSDFKQTVTAAKKLISIDKTPAVTGPQWQEFALVAAPVFEASQVVMITPSGSSPDLSKAGDYIFSTWPLPVNMARSLVQHIIRSNPRPDFAIVQVDNAFFEMFAKAFNEELTVAGGKVVATYHTLPEDKDFRTILTKLKSRGIKNVFASLLEGTQVPFYRQARELGLEVNFYAPYTIESDEDLVANLETAEGVVYPQISSLGSQEFVAKYQQRFSEKPNEAAAMSYDNVFIIAQAIEQCGYSGPLVKKCLDELGSYSGASGNISFDANGDLESPGEYTIRTVRNGQITNLTN